MIFLWTYLESHYNNWKWWKLFQENWSEKLWRCLKILHPQPMKMRRKKRKKKREQIRKNKMTREKKKNFCREKKSITNSSCNSERILRLESLRTQQIEQNYLNWLDGILQTTWQNWFHWMNILQEQSQDKNKFSILLERIKSI